MILLDLFIKVGLKVSSIAQLPTLYTMPRCSAFRFSFFMPVVCFSSCISVLIIFQTSIQVSRAAVEDLLLQLQGAREAEQEQRNRCSALEKQNVELQQDLWSLT